MARPLDNVAENNTGFSLSCPPENSPKGTNFMVKTNNPTIKLMPKRIKSAHPEGKKKKRIEVSNFGGEIRVRESTQCGNRKRHCRSREEWRNRRGCNQIGAGFSK